MDRTHHLRAIWDYLPAFRVVAETEHLPTAARALHVSPSSLSRAIGLAEAHVGSALFERIGRRIRLSAAGHTLLGAVRAAMRMVDEGLGALEGASLSGTVVIAASADIAAWLVAPALAQLRALAPGLVGELVVLPSDAAAALRRGDVDVVVATTILGGDELEVEVLTTARWGIHGAPGHRGPRELVAVAGAASPAPHDLRVGAVVEHSALAAAACRDGLVAWLPAPLAALHGLVRVAGTPAEWQTIHLMWRRPVTEHARTEVTLTALRTAARMRGAPAPRSKNRASPRKRRS